MQKSGMLLLGGMLLAFSLSGCSRSDAQEPDNVFSGNISGNNFTECREPRPEICYEVFAPVCASKDTEERVTFSNDCTACSDPAVRGFVAGQCR